MPVDEAVSSPRVHWDNQVFHVEPGFAEDAKMIPIPPNNQLIEWQSKNLFFGGVHTVIRTKNGVIEGASDHRRDGGVASC
jgi:gamma-glutamyltranspeptidase/glutathione hydrolase